MRFFPLRREFQVAYVALGCVFLGVALYLWKGWMASPAGHDRVFWDLLCNAVIVVLGIMLLLRPWRSRFGLDEESIYYADGFLPCRRIVLRDIHAVYSNGDKRMILYGTSGKRVFIDYTFERLEEFLAHLKAEGIIILDSPLKRR